jgi:hypothetical protein
MVHRDRDLGKERFWRGILQEWEQSKKTVRVFCLKRGFVESRFYVWRRTIARSFSVGLKLGHFVGQDEGHQRLPAEAGLRGERLEGGELGEGDQVFTGW